MHKSKEQGIALLYVLAILALLIAMGLAFMNSSIFDQKASALNAASTLADQLALSTIDGVIRGIQDKSTAIDTTTYSYSKNASNPSRDGLKAFQTVDYYNGATPVYLFEWDSSGPMKNASDNVQWNLHPININSSTNRIIGRTAYILIPPLSDGGQINPSDLIQKNANEAIRPEKRRGVFAYEMNAQDINATNIPFNSTTAKCLNYITNDVANVPGLMPESGWHSLDEFEKAMKLEDIITASNLKNAKEDIQRLFSFETIRNAEKYIMKNSNMSSVYDDLKNNQANVHRFYLPGFVDPSQDGIGTSAILSDANSNRWEKTDTRFVDSYILLDPAFEGKPSLDLLNLQSDYRWTDDHGVVPQSANDPVFGAGIPWLAAFGYKTDGTVDSDLKGTFSNVVDRRRQIAANLKDYSDSDNAPTSDVLPEDWSLTDSAKVPTYTGNEKTPYLNEFEISTSFLIRAYEDTGENYVEGTGEIDLSSEIIHMYEGLASSGATVRLLFSISDPKITIGWDNNTPTPHSFLVNSSTCTSVAGAQYTVEFSSSWAAGSDPGHFYATQTICPEITIPPIKADKVAGVLPTTGKAIISYTIVLEKAILEYDSSDGKGAIKSDYANINSSFTLSKEITFSVDSTTTDTIIDSVQTEDPRQNLNAGDWNKEIEGKMHSGDSTESGIGKRNAHSDPSAPTIQPGDLDPGYDIEAAPTPAYNASATNHLSTAHIRNAPMLSPWELGFIHRGKKWQTLNLTKYNKDKAIDAIELNSKFFLPGGGLYSEGDANILDQIKMTQFASSPSKINLAENSNQPELLNALLSIYDLAGTNALSITNKSRDVDELLGSTTTSSILANAKQFIIDHSAQFITRAKLAENTHLQIGNTKAQKEEIIGKVINLTEANKDLQHFQLIVLAQAIKNIGPEDGAQITVKKGYYKSDGTLDTIEVKPQLGKINFSQTAIGSDPDTFIIADEVLAERKYLVSGVIKSNGEVQITNIRTLK